jgi:hypothetical protein
MTFRMTTALLLASLLACSRSPEPSPEYERARALWTTVMNEKGMDAGDDPRAEQVLALLDRVPKESLDAAAAADMRSRISSLREASAAERERHARFLARLNAPADERPVAPGEGAPGTSGASPPIAIGMKLEAFRHAYGECMESKGPVKLEDPSGALRDGEMWVLKDGDDGDACRAEYPQLAGRAAVFVGGDLASLSPLSSMRTVEIPRASPAVPPTSRSAQPAPASEASAEGAAAGSER